MSTRAIPDRRRPARRAPGAAFAALCASAAAVSSCSHRARIIEVRLESLEAAERVVPQAVYRAAVENPDPLERLGAPLGRRLSLLQVRSAAEWASLRRAAPSLGAAPDFSRGSVVAIVCRAGQPLSHDWPIEIQDVRIHDGAGLVQAHFEAGTYLPDGTTVIEAVFVPGLAGVLVADVDGTRYVLN